MELGNLNHVLSTYSHKAHLMRSLEMLHQFYGYLGCIRIKLCISLALYLFIYLLFWLICITFIPALNHVKSCNVKHIHNRMILLMFNQSIICRNCKNAYSIKHHTALSACTEYKERQLLILMAQIKPWHLHQFSKGRIVH